jgi:aminopeptidase N
MLRVVKDLQQSTRVDNMKPSMVSGKTSRREIEPKKHSRGPLLALFALSSLLVFAGIILYRMKLDEAGLVAEPLDEHSISKIVSPQVYRLDLNVNIEKDAFSGIANIEVKASAPTRSFRLHATDLMIASVQVNGETASFSCDEDRLTIEAPHDIEGDATVSVSYSGHMSTKMCGLYRSTCPVKDGEATRSMWSTQFESCDARRVFPCVDEPAKKSHFEISVTTSAMVDGREMVVLSNMPVK